MSEPALRSLLEEGVDRGFFPGAAALVSDGQEVLWRAVMGDARVAPPGASAPAVDRTLWDLAELTEPLAGAPLALALAEEKHFSLSDPLRRFHDLYKKMRFEGVTLHRLLTHTAGLPTWFPCYVRGEGRASYRRTLSGIDPQARPGQAVADSGLGYLLLADVLETVATRTVDLLFRERVADRLGLGNDLLFSPEGPDGARCAGGEADDETERRRVEGLKLRYASFRSGVVNGQVNDGNAWRRGAGVSLNAGLFGTLDAVGALGRALLARDRRLLGESSFEEWTRLQTGSLPEARGLGWHIDPAPGPSGSAGSRLSRTGLTGSSMLVDGRAGRVHVLLTNRLHPRASAADLDAFRARFHEAAADL